MTAGRTHLFFAMSNFAFGEVALALRLAWQLHARGDRVSFLTPSGLAVLFENTPFKHGHLDAVWGSIDQVLPAIVAEQRVDSVVVVDAASVYLALAVTRRDDAFLRRLPVPVIAFDVWNLPETNLEWDTGTEIWRIAPQAAQFAHRLCPVPFIRPEAAAGRYNALPERTAVDREAVRRELGIDREPLVITATGTWQTARAAISPYHAHLIDVVPPVLVSHLDRVGARVLHVGPQPLAGAAEQLGERYRWIGQVGGKRMVELMASADVCVSLNASATTISSALVLELPVLLATSSLTAETAAELPPSLARLAPLRPFKVWPLGLHAFLEPVFRGNPYLDAVSHVELFAGDAFVSTCRAVLADEDARAAARARMAAYRELVAKLPRAVELFDTYL